MKQVILSVFFLLSGLIASSKAFSYSQCFNEYASPNTNYATQIAFTNQTGKFVNVYWINFLGQRVFAGSLEQNQTLDFNTFYRHVWVLTDVWGNCIQSFFAGPTFTPYIIY